MGNMTRSTAMKVLLAVVAVAVLGIGTALVQENKAFNRESAPDAEFTWAAPTSGSPVHHYIAQILVNERDTLFFDPVMTESVMVPVIYGNKYRLRVAAVDGDQVRGPMSMWSLPYSPELAPPGF
jgi:hypothetical protein